MELWMQRPVRLYVAANFNFSTVCAIATMKFIATTWFCTMEPHSPYTNTRERCWLSTRRGSTGHRGTVK